MELFKRLYNTVWLAFFACVLLPRSLGALPGAITHVVVGLGMLFLTLGNAKRLAALPVPARLQRISKTTSRLAAGQLVVGVILGAVTHVPVLAGLPVVGTVLRGAHMVVAFAMLAQAASVATAYDMWEEKEFDTSTPKPPPSA